MKKVRFGFDDDERRRDAGEEDEREHEKNRRIKSEQERLLRRQLSRLHTADAAHDELEDGAPRSE